MPFLREARAVFFDVDDTLYDFEESMRYAFAHLHHVFPEILGRHGEDRVSNAYWSYYRGYPEPAKVALINSDPDLFRRTMWAGALVNLGVDSDEAAAAWLRKVHPTLDTLPSDPDGFVRILTTEFEKHRPDHWRRAMYPGARELLHDLKGRGTILGAITNGPAAVQRPKLEALGYREFFEESRVFVSGEFGVRKPDASIFLAAAKAAGVAANECAMVGDAREFDMPAKAVGFRTVLFDGKEKEPDCAADPYPPDARVTSYHELRAVLGLR
jgi:putative hydrolase of the HAD superfamily